MKTITAALPTLSVAGLPAQTSALDEQSRQATRESRRSIRHVGRLSGESFTTPNVNAPPIPLLAGPGAIYNGRRARGFGAINSARGYPDMRSFRRKFGLVIPATNTSMEYELWSIVFANPSLSGVGLHTVNVVTPKPTFETEADLLNYQKQFVEGLKAAVDTADLAKPEYMIMGMSLEHIIAGLDEVRASVKDVEAYSGLKWATWHDAARAALLKFGARRIGLLTPFDRKGNESAKQMFEELGFEVVATFGFSCANAMHIAHIPDWAKEEAILEYLATDENQLEAVVQCGTNMSLLDVTKKLEPVIGIPILGINAVTFWYALRENGILDPLKGGGRLLREF